MLTLVNPLVDDVKQAVPTQRDLGIGVNAAAGFAAGKGVRIAVDKAASFLPASVQPYLQMGAIGISLGDILAAAATLMGVNLVQRWAPRSQAFGIDLGGDAVKTGAYLAALYPVALGAVTGAMAAIGQPALAAKTRAALGYFDDDLGGAWGAIAPINGPEYMKMTGLGDPSQYNTAAIGADIPTQSMPIGLWDYEGMGDDLSPSAIAG